MDPKEAFALMCAEYEINPEDYRVQDDGGNWSAYLKENDKIHFWWNTETQEWYAH